MGIGFQSFPEHGQHGSESHLGLLDGLGPDPNLIPGHVPLGDVVGNFRGLPVFLGLGKNLQNCFVHLELLLQLDFFWICLP